jgi:hypothetical protein
VQEGEEDDEEEEEEEDNESESSSYGAPYSHMLVTHHALQPSVRVKAGSMTCHLFCNNRGRVWNIRLYSSQRKYLLKQQLAVR